MLNNIILNHDEEDDGGCPGCDGCGSGCNSNISADEIAKMFGYKEDETTENKETESKEEKKEK